MSTIHNALLFDLDGTLTDNYLGIARSIRHAIARLGGADPDEATLRRCVGPPLRESFRSLLDTDDAGLVEQAIAHYRERFSDVGWRENVVYDGIPEVMAALAATDRPMFLCTSKPEVFARRIVTLFGFTDHLRGVYGTDLAGTFDDKVKLFRHLTTQEGVDPAGAIMIGDRSHDVRAARMNGARSIGVLWGYGTPEELAAADAVIATPADLAAAVAQLGGAAS